ncbi:CopD family protein [Comamonas sp. JUb58]|uniref:CopD family protein n=1 Tax=Comamonas sp. JUb58 TaxID=2485114 RepID=UPI00106185A3|nr:CopD family protein [Comamonas sp. JUb58]TDS78830.1 putative membrane protein [Comamonas sp. JUb58]
MLYVILKTVHLLSIIVWLGGMAFAHFFLRPALQQLEPPQRLMLMRDVLQRFFAVVLVIIAAVLLSGIGMMGLVHSMAAQAGAKFSMLVSWMVMAVLGLAMMAVFGHIRFALFKRLDQAVNAKDWPAGGKALGQIRQLVALNLALGVVIVLFLRVPL